MNIRGSLSLCFIISAFINQPVKAQKHPHNVDASLRHQVDVYLSEYNRHYQNLYKESALAAWALNTKIIPNDSTNAVRARKADEAMSAFTGSDANTHIAQQFLTQKEKLSALEVRQLQKIVYLASNNPASLRPLVADRIKAETQQTETLFGYSFKLDGKELSTNQIDSILEVEKDITKRQKVWELSKEVGSKLKDGLARLQNLRNKTVQGMGYSDYFHYQVSDYGMSTSEMMELNKKLVRELWPLYRELHTWARYELAKKYGQQVPEYLPAHWLPNRWAQEWTELVDVKGLDLNKILAPKGPEWVVRSGENFYKSIGFPALPPSFYEKSSLYPLPKGVNYTKNNHASAWHIDLQNDVRSLMSVEANEKWYGTVNHELGHIYYYMSYSNPQVPFLLREGANRAYHEAIGTMMGMAAMQEPFLAGQGLLPAKQSSDKIQLLLKDAMRFVVFQPFSSGTMTEFEHDLYAKNLPKEEYNTRWWQLAKKYQGIVPPTNRGEEFCDAASKTHINDDAAQYYDYGLSHIILFQLHEHIAKNILKQDVHATNYWGNKSVGKFLQKIMAPGGSRDWRVVLKENTGSDLSAAAMLRYFEPLNAYLKKANAGRVHTLPEKFE